MEILASYVWASLRERFSQASVIANRRSNRWLLAWWLASLPRVLVALVTRRADAVLTGDALAFALFRPLLRLARVRHATMIMGLDVTYGNRGYRAIVHPALRRCPRVIAISHATARAASEIGVPHERITVIRLGVPAPTMSRDEKSQASEALRESLGIASDEVIALTVGRLVRRKGVHWFVRSVLPHLPESVVYVVAGDGPMAGEIRAAVDELRLAPRVRLLGLVDDETRERVMRGADLFVQPNVPVPGDMEGFGLVVVEAAMRGTLTVASGIDGIVDAVIDKQTGILLPPENSSAWVEAITALVSNVGQLRDVGWQWGAEARRSYGVREMGDQLAELLQNA